MYKAVLEPATRPGISDFKEWKLVHIVSATLKTPFSRCALIEHVKDQLGRAVRHEKGEPTRKRCIRNLADAFSHIPSHFTRLSQIGRAGDFHVPRETFSKPEVLRAVRVVLDQILIDDVAEFLLHPQCGVSLANSESAQEFLLCLTVVPREYVRFVSQCRGAQGGLTKLWDALCNPAKAFVHCFYLGEDAWWPFCEVSKMMLHYKHTLGIECDETGEFVDAPAEDRARCGKFIEAAKKTLCAHTLSPAGDTVFWTAVLAAQHAAVAYFRAVSSYGTEKFGIKDFEGEFSSFTYNVGRISKEIARDDTHVFVGDCSRDGFAQFCWFVACEYYGISSEQPKSAYRELSHARIALRAQTVGAIDAFAFRTTGELQQFAELDALGIAKTRVTLISCQYQNAHIGVVNWIKSQCRDACAIFSATNAHARAFERQCGYQSLAMPSRMTPSALSAFAFQTALCDGVSVVVAEQADAWSDAQLCDIIARLPEHVTRVILVGLHYPVDGAFASIFRYSNKPARISKLFVQPIVFDADKLVLSKTLLERSPAQTARIAPFCASEPVYVIKAHDSVRDSATIKTETFFHELWGLCYEALLWSEGVAAHTADRRRPQYGMYPRNHRICENIRAVEEFISHKALAASGLQAILSLRKDTAGIGVKCGQPATVLYHMSDTLFLEHAQKIHDARCFVFTLNYAQRAQFMKRLPGHALVKRLADGACAFKGDDLVYMCDPRHEYGESGMYYVESLVCGESDVLHRYAYLPQHWDMEVQEHFARKATDMSLNEALDETTQTKNEGIVANKQTYASSSGEWDFYRLLPVDVERKEKGGEPCAAERSIVLRCTTEILVPRDTGKGQHAHREIPALLRDPFLLPLCCTGRTIANAMDCVFLVIANAIGPGLNDLMACMKLAARAVVLVGSEAEIRELFCKYGAENAHYTEPQ
jgi:hypothetical protein